MENLDVIIIGAGIIGCATAFELSKAGYKTLNIDKLGDAGMGSTSNSCALVRMTYSTMDGIQMARECFSYWKDWENYLGVTDERGMAQFINRGTVSTLSEQPNFPRMLRIFEELGIEHELWEGDEIAERLPHISQGSYYPATRIDDERFWADAEDEIERVLHVRDGGYINDPQLSTHNLKVAAEAHGGQFLFNRAVTDVRRADGRVAGVTLDDGEEIDAPIVINIAGPHSRIINQMAGVEDDMRINTRPLRHEVHFVPNPNPELETIGSHWSDVDVGVYYRPEAGDALLIGSKDPECDPHDWVDHPDHFNRSVTDLQWKHQVYRLARRLPDLKIPNQPKGIVDLYDVTEDWIPIYDKSNLPGYYMAIGTSGNQFKNAGPVGYLMLQLINAVEGGHDHDIDPIKYEAAYNKFEVDTGFYSRLREINPESSFSVSG
ncbi:MAG: NAD(P)/FAD-dependent oxidoreductase [Candidatus Promineifilaceae bacterium]